MIRPQMTVRRPIRPLSATLGSVVEARSRRYQRNEWTEDHAELLNFVDRDDIEYHHPQQRDDQERQQCNEQVRDSPTSLVFQRPRIIDRSTTRGRNVMDLLVR